MSARSIWRLDWCDTTSTRLERRRRSGIGRAPLTHPQNPGQLWQADWTIADVERLGREVGLTVTPPRRGSHYKVRDPGGGTTLTIPARRPIKAIYIRALVAL